MSSSDLLRLLGNVSEQVVEQRIESILQQVSKSNQVLYGCIVQRHFLQNSLRANPFYAKHVLCRNLKEQKVLEVGCCLGTDTRRLIDDGVSLSNIVAIDVNFQFIQLGFQLFQDQDKPIASRFFEKSVAADDLVEFLQKNTSLPPFDIIVANAVIHTLTLEDCKKAVQNFAKLLEEDGVLIGYLPTLREGERNEPYKMIEAFQNSRVLHSKSHFQEILKDNDFSYVEMCTRGMEQVFGKQQEKLKDWENVDITFFVAQRRLFNYQSS
ncbi:hypothetical protein GAYE_SCF09G3206 [Galdieria yellowstonensis]|uniref:Methyltransferase type 12 domain-containing protein n=1 Tax=Galdieria yellowstonensis TaxID=3028027 RepID=A0AAV9IDG2_9RHOD|nr:hypothetical protein GAYE_SCF09G3206 [Galdieria yellowstonensis]